MANIGYIRIGTIEQTPSQQLERLSLDKIFEEKISSSAKTRPILAECIAYCMNFADKADKSDKVSLHVHSIDRLARNLIELQGIVEELTQKGVTVHFHVENLTFPSVTDKTPQPIQKTPFQFLEAFAQFERSLIKERQLEGIERAKKQGKHLGRPRKLSREDRIDILAKLKKGESPKALAEEYSVDVSSIYKLS